jgi:hypothetical protein
MITTIRVFNIVAVCRYRRLAMSCSRLPVDLATDHCLASPRSKHSCYDTLHIRKSWNHYLVIHPPLELPIVILFVLI